MRDKMTKKQLEQAFNDQLEEMRRLKRYVLQSELNTESYDLTDRVNDQATTQILEAQAAIERAEDQWALNVTEPQYKGNYQQIDTYIRSVQGLGWSWEKPYTKDGQFEWCGAACAFFYQALRPNVRKKTLPSCYRLYRDWANTSRRVSTPQKGDICVVWTGKDRNKYGHHITLCVDAHDDYIDTIEGNAKGLGCEDKTVIGVIKRSRNIEDIAHIYRPLREDFS